MPENRNLQPITKEMLNNFIRNLRLGDEVYLPEYKDNPDTKFGRIKVKVAGCRKAPFYGEAATPDQYRTC